MKKVKKRLFYSGAVILLLIVLFAWLGFKKPKPEYSTVLAAYGPLTQTVSETGTIKPIREISLNFLSAGKIDNVLVEVGDNVEAGQILATLDSSFLIIQRQETEAALNIALANLSKIETGASQEVIEVAKKSLEQAQSAEEAARFDLEKTLKKTAEEIRQAEKTYNDLIIPYPDVLPVARQTVLSAQTDLENTKKTFSKTIENTQSSLFLALGDKLLTVRVAMDNINNILEDDETENILSIEKITYKTETENGRTRILNSLPNFEDLLNKARTSKEETDLLTAADFLSTILSNTMSVLDTSYLMLENTITTANFSQTELDSYKSLIINQSTKVNTAISSLETNIQAYKNAILNYETKVSSAQSLLEQAQIALDNAILTASNNLNNVKLVAEQQQLAASTRLENAIKATNLAKAQYENTISPASSQDLRLARAQVEQAQAALESIDKQISDLTLIAPMSGVITEINFKPGEQFVPGAGPMIKMLVDNNFKIEVDISEANISKVKVGNKVDITLDAFPDDLILKGEVDFIEPAQTLISGVVYYKVIIEFANLKQTSDLLADYDLSLKSGMTANIVIITNQRENVLSVPSRAIIEDNGQKTVRILRSEDYYEEIKVETGLRGDNGLIEIKGEINPGDKIITLIRDNN